MNYNMLDTIKHQRLLKLTEFWYDYVGCDHHKDRDCHFYINQVWSYGQEPYYRIEHYGYMSELDDDTRYETYEEALDAFIVWLETEIKEVYAGTPPDWEDTEKWDYNWKGVMDTLKEHNLYAITFRQ